MAIVELERMPTRPAALPPGVGVYRPHKPTWVEREGMPVKVQGPPPEWLEAPLDDPEEGITVTRLGIMKIPSMSEEGVHYRVRSRDPRVADIDPADLWCECPAFARWGDRRPCKHLKLVAEVASLGAGGFRLVGDEGADRGCAPQREVHTDLLQPWGWALAEADNGLPLELIPF